jgi:hypothetical protein
MNSESKSGIGIDAYLGVGVGYLDVAEKQYAHPHPYSTILH